MNSPARGFPWIAGAGLSLLALSLALAFLLAGVRSRLRQAQALPVYGTVNDFSLTNQSAAAVSLADLRGHVWVADIFFTRCAGPCLRMSRQMKELQDALPAQSSTRLVSVTTDPDFDTPAVLVKYGQQRFGADTNRWLFFTGPRPEIMKLASGGLKLSAVPKTPAERGTPEDLFIHSTIFVVVDRQARLRGIFETGGEGVAWSEEKQRILSAIGQLEREK